MSFNKSLAHRIPIHAVRNSTPLPSRKFLYKCTFSALTRACLAIKIYYKTGNSTRIILELACSFQHGRLTDMQVILYQSWQTWWQFSLSGEEAINGVFRLLLTPWLAFRQTPQQSPTTILITLTWTRWLVFCLKAELLLTSNIIMNKTHLYFQPWDCTTKEQDMN